MHLDIQAPEVLVVVELLRSGKFSAEHVQMISEKRRLVRTPRRRGVWGFDLPPLVLLHVPPLELRLWTAQGAALYDSFY